MHIILVSKFVYFWKFIPCICQKRQNSRIPFPVKILAHAEELDWTLLIWVGSAPTHLVRPKMTGGH